MIYQRIEGLNRKDQHVALADLQYNDASALILPKHVLFTIHYLKWRLRMFQ